MDNETKNKFDLSKFRPLQIEWEPKVRDEREDRAIEFRRRLSDVIPSRHGIVTYAKIWKAITDEVNEMRVPELFDVFNDSVEMLWISSDFSRLTIMIDCYMNMNISYNNKNSTIGDKCEYSEIPELLRAWNPILRIFA